MGSIEIQSWSPEHADAWARVCRESPDAWFWHTRDWVDYQWSYGQERVCKDLSFLILNQGEVVAVCPVFLEMMDPPHGDHLELAFAGAPTPGPAISDRQTRRQHREVLAVAYDHLATLARQYRAKRITVRRGPTPTGEGVADQMAELQEHGFLDISLLTQVIDLRLGRERLWSDLRNSYRPLINRGQRELTVRVYSHDQPPGPAFDSYQKLHAAAAGRVTRPQRTFDLMHEWVDQGKALLIEALHEAEPTGYALLLCAKQGAYYGSGCCAPNIDLPYLMHTLQWYAIASLFERGYQWYELGHQHLSPTLAHPVDPKGRAISFFKRGIGGLPRVCVVGERFLSSALIDSVITQRLREYEKLVKGSPDRTGNDR